MLKASAQGFLTLKFLVEENLQPMDFFQFFFENPDPFRRGKIWPNKG